MQQHQQYQQPQQQQQQQGKIVGGFGAAAGAFGATGGAFGQTGGTFSAPQAGGFGGGLGGSGAFGDKPTTAAFGAPTGGAFGAPAAGGFGQTGGFPPPTEPRESAAAPRSALDNDKVRMNLDDLEAQAQGQAEEAKVSVELEQDIWSLSAVLMLQGTAESAGATKWWIYVCAYFTLLLQGAIVTSLVLETEIKLFGEEPEFTDNTLVEVNVPTERNGSQPWLVRDGDMKYNVFSPAVAAELANLDDNTVFWSRDWTWFWSSNTLFWNVPKNHTLYHTHVKIIRGGGEETFKSLTNDMCRILALVLLGLNLGREFMDISQVLTIYYFVYRYDKMLTIYDFVYRNDRCWRSEIATFWWTTSCSNCGERPWLILTATVTAYSTGALPRLTHLTGKRESVLSTGKTPPTRDDDVVCACSEEFGGAIREMFGLMLNEEELKLIINEYDADGNGNIDSAEFIKFVTKDAGEGEEGQDDAAAEKTNPSLALCAS